MGLHIVDRLRLLRWLRSRQHAGAHCASHARVPSCVRQCDPGDLLPAAACTSFTTTTATLAPTAAAAAATAPTVATAPTHAQPAAAPLTAAPLAVAATTSATSTAPASTIATSTAPTSAIAFATTTGSPHYESVAASADSAAALPPRCEHANHNLWRRRA